MSNIDQLRRLLTAMREIVEPASQHAWTRPTDEQYFAFLQRAIVVRQWEALHAIVALSDKQSTHFGVTFLRPAYEELIWLEYLLANPKEANQIVILWARKSVAESVTQQAQHLGATVARKIGWSKREVAAQKSALTAINSQLSTIGRRIGWTGGIPPSFRWVSNQVGRADEYKFIYHATSSYVHFSPHELLRRVWGKHGTVSVSSTHFAEYWEEFAAYWAIHTFVRVVAALGDSLLDLATDVDDTVLDIIEQLQPVPIIIPDELRPWPEPPPPKSPPPG